MTDPRCTVTCAIEAKSPSGKRADLIRVKEVGGMPVVRDSWCRGERAC